MYPTPVKKQPVGVGGLPPNFMEQSGIGKPPTYPSVPPAAPGLTSNPTAFTGASPYQTNMSGSSNPTEERKSAAGMSTGTYNQGAAWNANFQAGVGGLVPGAQARSTAAYAPAAATYTAATGPAGATDPAQLAKLRTGYEGFAATGGFTPTQEGQFIRQSTSGIPAAYNVLEDQLRRSRAITGGYTPGGELSQMARHEGQDVATSTTAAKSQLAQIEAQNKLAGMGGLKDLETGVAMQKLQAAGGLANLYQAEPGYVTTLLKTLISGEAVGTEAQNQSTRIMAELSRNPGLAQTIFNDIIAAAGAAAGVSKAIP